MTSGSSFGVKRVVRPHGKSELRTGRTVGKGIQCPSKIHSALVELKNLTFGQTEPGGARWLLGQHSGHDLGKW